jgi:hypothetical protein
MWESSVVLGTVHSDRTVVVLLHKQFSFLLNTCNCFNIVMYCVYAAMSKSNIMAYVNNSFTFFKLSYYI